MKGLLFRDDTMPPQHYYGDRVRFFYCVGAMSMLVTVPFFAQRLPIDMYGAIGLIILVALFAGLTNPVQLWTALFDLVSSLVAVSLFTYYAIITYLTKGGSDSFLWINELLSLVFLFSLYYAAKTVRGFLVERKLS